MSTTTIRPLGKRPAVPGAVKLQLAHYLDTAALPPIPASYGHENLVVDWQMFGNDQYGDCVWAGADHDSMLWCAEAGQPVTFSDATALADYAAVTGFDPNDPSSDQGTEMLAACKYRQRSGVRDTTGKRHRIGAYLALNPGDVAQLHAAAYLFDGVGVGVQFPREWFTAFDAGRAWGAVRSPHLEGGHYITAICRRRGRTGVVSWGRIVWLTDGGYKQFNDETYVYLAPEKLRAGVDMQGLDLATLRTDLARLTTL